MRIISLPFLQYLRIARAYAETEGVMEGSEVLLIVGNVVGPREAVELPVALRVKELLTVGLRRSALTVMKLGSGSSLAA